MAKRISQREARRLRKRVEELERQQNQQRSRWAQEFVGGTQIATDQHGNAQSPVPVAVRTARMLRHAVVVVGDETANLRFFALPLPEAQ